MTGPIFTADQADATGLREPSSPPRPVRRKRGNKGLRVALESHWSSRSHLPCDDPPLPYESRPKTNRRSPVLSSRTAGNSSRNLFSARTGDPSALIIDDREPSESLWPLSTLDEDRRSLLRTAAGNAPASEGAPACQSKRYLYAILVPEYGRFITRLCYPSQDQRVFLDYGWPTRAHP